MKKLLKIFLATAAVFILIIIAAFAYLNLVYLPAKVKAEGPAYLQQKSKGQLKAQSIQYVPFKGVKLESLSLLSRAGKPLANLDKVYLDVNIWPLISRRDLDFRLDLYPPGVKRPFIFKGLYQTKAQKLELNFKIKSSLFIPAEPIFGTVGGFVDAQEQKVIDCKLTSPNLNLQSKFYVKDKDLQIDKFSLNILQSSLSLIGDVQDLSEPSLNIYGDLDLNLADLKHLNPEYIRLPDKLQLAGRLPGKIYISSKVNNPEVGLKISSGQLQINRIKVENLSLLSKVENKKLVLDKLYARLCDGEINLAGECLLDSAQLPANLNLNIFSLDLHRLISAISLKPSPLHGRLFGLGQFQSSLKRPKDVEGKLWLSASGSNILQLPIFKGIGDVLHLPELRKVEFKEGSGNFTIAQQKINSSDFKVLSEYISLYFNGYMGFNGDLEVNIRPSFSQGFLSSPNIGNILGIFVDTAGNLLGEIKMDGNIKQARFSFEPISVEKLIQKGIEKGLKQLFKFKTKEE